MITINKEIPVLAKGVGKNDALFLNKLWACVEHKGKKPGFGVQQLAKCMQLSRIQLNRKLLKLTGYSPGKLITYYRMHIAKQMLSEGRETIKEIAWKCGFLRHAGFCRSFSQEFGCSPSRYRSNNKTNGHNKQFKWKIPLCEEDFIHLLNLACQKNWLAQLLKMVIMNLGNKIFTIGQLAAALCLSPCSLNRRVKELFTVTPQRIIKGLRLQYASELLAAKSASIAEIAYRTGFFDPAHFCRSFKSAFGCQPSAYKGGNNTMSIFWLEGKLMNQNGK